MHMYHGRDAGGGAVHAHQVIQPKVGPAAALRVHPREQLVQGVAWAEAPRAPPSVWQPDYARGYAPLARRWLRQQHGRAFLQTPTQSFRLGVYNP